MIDKKQGFSLIEIIVATAISTMIIAGLITIYLSNKQSYQFQQEMSLQQERARLALYIIENEIREAGYIGCPRFSNSFYNLTTHKFSQMDLISGSDALPSITISKMSSPIYSLMSSMFEYNKLVIPSKPKLKKNKVILIGDCRHVVMAEVLNVKTNKGKQEVTLKKNSPFLFKKSDWLGVFDKKTLFIKNTERFKKNGGRVYALYKKDFGSKSQELVPGVSSMSLSYAVRDKENNKPSGFVKAHQVNDWRMVVAVKIDLEVEGERDILPRSSWNSIVYLRNMGGV